MTAKEYLNQARTIDRERKVKETEIKNLKKDVQTLNSLSFGERVVSSHVNKSMSNIDKIVDMETEIKLEINTLIDLKREIRGKIGRLKRAEYRIILTDYYINGRTLEEIAESNNYDISHVKRLKKSAVETFAKIFGLKLSQNELF